MCETQDFYTRSRIKNYLVSYYKREVRFLFDYAHETRCGFSGDDFWPSHGNNGFGFFSHFCVCVCVSVQVVDQSGLLDEAACVLSSLELRLNEGSCLSRDTVHLRIKELQKTITQMHSE